MKARFYRGPWNGKVREVRDSEYSIAVAEMNKKPIFYSENIDPMTDITYKTHIYYRTNHTHPDGSVFFEWGQPRKK